MYGCLKNLKTELTARVFSILIWEIAVDVWKETIMEGWPANNHHHTLVGISEEKYKFLRKIEKISKKYGRVFGQ